MDNVTFGMTVTLVGMGGTLSTLWFITLMVALLKRVLPYGSESSANGKETH